MASNSDNPSRFNRTLPRLSGLAVLAFLLAILRFLFFRFPIGATVVGTAFRYVSIIYLAGRLIEWLLQVVSRYVSNWNSVNQEDLPHE